MHIFLKFQLIDDDACFPRKKAHSPPPKLHTNCQTFGFFMVSQPTHHDETPTN